MSATEQLYNNLSNQKKYNNKKASLNTKLESLQKEIEDKREEQKKYDISSVEYINLSFEISNIQSEITTINEEIVNIDTILYDLQIEAEELNAEVGLEDITSVTQAGHIYPTVQVVFWTKKLNSYNKQLDGFISKMDNYDNTANKKWVAEKVQKFCMKVNYALAWLRYYIIKALQGAYKQAQDLLKMFSPIVKIAEGGEPLTAILEWINSVITFFQKPYDLIVTFIQDVMTYTPPLIKETTTLVTKVGTVPPKLVAKTTQIVGELSDEALKNIDLKFESISLGDIINGTEPEKPNKDDYIKK